jgi:stage V sporulation protein B
MEIRKQSFIKGAAILAVAGLITKILGAIYKLPLNYIIGSEAIGYYQASYDWYVWALTISTYALPIAISKLVSEKIELGRRDEAHKIFKVALSLAAALGLAVSLFLFLFSNSLVGLFKNPGSYYAVAAIAPAIFLVSISASVRGYFQGMQNMVPSAVSQVTEQFGRVLFGYILAIMLLPRGPELSAGGAAFGTSVGAFLSVILLVFMYRRYRPAIMSSISNLPRRKAESITSIVKRILVFAIPITIGGSIMPVMGLIDSLIVFDRLQAAGYQYTTAVQMYGQLKALALSFINLPQIITISLGASLVPAIAESLARRDMDSARRKSELGIRLSLLIGLPAAMGLFILADPIMMMVSPRENVVAGIALRYLAPAAIFLTLVQTLTGILQGMGKERIPVVNLFIGALVKVVISYTLTSIPYINIRGAALGTVFGYAVPCVLNLMAIIKYQNQKLDYTRTIIKPLIASGIMTVTAYYTYNMVLSLAGSNTLSTMISILLSVLVYGIALLLIKGVTVEELQMAPGGSQLSATLKKKGLMK